MTRNRATAVVGACALGGACALWLNVGGSPPVTDPSSAPALLELAFSMAASARPDVPLAAMIARWHAVAVAAAAALSAFAVWRLTRSTAASAAIGIALAASPVMLPALAPTAVTALAVAAAAWSAIIGGSAAGVIVSLTVASAITPGLTLPGAVLCWMAGRRLLPAGRGVREALGIAAAAICLAVSVTVTLWLPPLPEQSVTRDALRVMIPLAANAGNALQATARVLSSLGPMAIALAALGLFSAVSKARNASDEAALPPRGRALAAGFSAAVLIAAMCPNADPARTFAPLVAGVWILAGRGLAEILALAGHGWYRAGGLAIVAVLLAINLEPRVNQRRGAAGEPVLMGHDTLTRHNFQALMYELPPGSALVAEDAVSDILLRSLSDSLRRSRNGISIEARDADVIAVARGTRRVFALPRAQSELQTRGVQLSEGLVPAVDGFAEVIGVQPCDVATQAWQTARSAEGAARLALISDSDDSRGPLVLYSGGPEPVVAAPVGWPALAMRGFDTRRYDRTTPQGREALLHEVVNEAAPTGHPAVNAAHVTRTELWRVPGGPRALVVTWSIPPTAVLAAELPRATGSLRLCPVFPFPVRDFKKRHD